MLTDRQLHEFNIRNIRKVIHIRHNSLSIDEDGNIDIKPRRQKFKPEDEEINSCLKKAELIGKA